MVYKLPVGQIIAGSLAIAWFSRREYIKAITVPTLLIVGIWALSAALTPVSKTAAGWITLPLFALAFTLFAVSCHRFILIRPVAGARISVAIGRREWRFMYWAAGIYVIVALCKMIPLAVILNVEALSSSLADGEMPYWMTLIGSIPAWYVLGRMSLVFPAVAIDKDASLAWSWQKTRGNGWRMFAVVGLFPMLIDAAIWLVWRDEATIVEDTLLSIVYFIGLSIQIFALSFSYRALEKQD